MRWGKGSYEFVMNESVLGNFSGSASYKEVGELLVGEQVTVWINPPKKDGGKAGPKEQIHT
jgi:hypothetical protein